MFNTLTVKAVCTACGKGTVKHKVTLTKCGAFLHPAKCYRCGHKWESSHDRKPPSP